MKSALAFAAVAAAALAAPGTELWSKPLAPGAFGSPSAAPVAFKDGSAVVFATPNGVTSYDQATGAVLGSYSAPRPELVPSPARDFNFLFPGDGTAVGLAGPHLNMTFKTEPLQELNLCGADEHLLVVSGRVDGASYPQAVTLFVDVRSGVTIKKVTGVWHGSAYPTYCAFAGRGRSLTARASNAKGVRHRFHDGQPAQKIVSRDGNDDAAAHGTRSVFVRYGSDPNVVTRYDYTPAGGVTWLSSVWNVTAPAPSGAAYLEATPDGSTVVCGVQAAIHVASGKVRAAMTNVDTSVIMTMVMYRKATALVSLSSELNDVIVYDFAKLEVVLSFYMSGPGWCFGAWEPVTSMELLPESKLIMAWTDASPYTLRSTTPRGALYLTDRSTMMAVVSSQSSPGVVFGVDYGSSVSLPKVRQYNTTTWREEWSFPLPAGSSGVDFGPKSRRVFVDTPTNAWAFGL